MANNHRHHEEILLDEINNDSNELLSSHHPKRKVQFICEYMIMSALAYMPNNIHL